jgi:hypothetical protein
MKRFLRFAVAVLVFGLVGAAESSADSLIVNGSFESPDVGSYALISNGGVPGWATTDGAGVIEIDNTSVFGGGSAAYDGIQSLEVNAYNPEDVYQTVTGLTVGQTYVLSWAYGDRPGSGDEGLAVYFGSNALLPADLVTTDYDNLNGSNSTVLWFENSYIVTATSATETLSFNGLLVPGVDNNGGPSYGNEVDAVSLVATPEPSTLLLLSTGLGLLGFALRRQRSLRALSRF